MTIQDYKNKSRREKKPQVACRVVTVNGEVHIVLPKTINLDKDTRVNPDEVPYVVAVPRTDEPGPVMAKVQLTDATGATMDANVRVGTLNLFL